MRRLPRAQEYTTYELRREQEEAAAMTAAYFQIGGTEFLWNAKPRFGKTLTSYDMIRRMGFTKVLIVTNRPSIANSWAEDFHRFIGWRGALAFVSDTEALRGREGVLTREAYTSLPTMEDVGMVALESLQGLKGSVYFGGEYDKLRWISELEFDLLIVDEAQEGIDTMRTERAFRQISRAHTLYLSGTPFKALASAQFAAEQIYNWSYADKQEAKDSWADDAYNPYEPLPRLAMFTYQLSPMIEDDLRQGIDLGEERAEYAFDLNEFFATNEGGRFVHEEEVRRFLYALRTNEKYPYSTPALRAELTHTLWLLNRVASAKALAKLLQNDPVFADYEIVLAAGDGALDDVRASEAAYDRVRAAIRDHERTITLSVGQLTVGVTIPEWSGVLMLCNLQSPSSYMQVAESIAALTETVKEHLRTEVIAPVAAAYEVKPRARERMERQAEQEVERRLTEIHEDYAQQTNIARAELARRRDAAETADEVTAAEAAFSAEMTAALHSLTEAAQAAAKEAIEEKPAELVERMERAKAEEKKRTLEDEVRARLRGFSRTIPSFVMAYGDAGLTLANFDDYTEDDVFAEVTGITEAEFRFLRDGGTYTHPETGAEEYFAGHLFDEMVFNDSIAEFLKKREELADYFDEAHTEDIFDYIPPQRTNQIFTPRAVVRRMVDALDAENPGCFDDPTRTFADLYMKSGLYITEIVKRLYRSEKIKAEYPNDADRIRHILRNQVYGMAPTRIIYLIATNYILGFDAAMRSETRNFVQADAAQAAKDGRLAELVEECFAGRHDFCIKAR